jgi:hypothetical protein
MSRWRGADIGAPTRSSGTFAGDRQTQLAVVHGESVHAWSALVLLERHRDFELHLLGPRGSTKSEWAIAHALPRFAGADRAPDDGAREALRSVGRWFARQAGRDAVREADDAQSAGHGKVLRALHAAFHALPRHAKARLSHEVAEARAFVSHTHGAGIERELELAADAIRKARAGDADEFQSAMELLKLLRATSVRREGSHEGHPRMDVVIVSLRVLDH